MDKETKGAVIAIKKQWWLKVNTKPVRKHALDGAVFPHIIEVEYTVDGKVYRKRQWIKAGKPTPSVGSYMTVIFDENKPSKAKVL